MVISYIYLCTYIKHTNIYFYRYMPLLDMLQEIHFKLLKRVTEKRDEMMTKELQLCPKIKKILDERITQSRKWRAVWDGATRYQVKYNTRFVTVDLEQRSCDCRVFDLSGIPCAHALAAIFDRRHKPIDYVSDYFKRDKYLNSYAFPLQALKGIDFWDYHEEVEVLLPPEIPKKLRGRPKRLRRREEWEGGTQGKKDSTVEQVQRWSGKRVHHCSNCRKTGHRRPSCPQLTTESQGGNTEGQTQQGGQNAAPTPQGHGQNPPANQTSNEGQGCSTETHVFKRTRLGLGRPKLPIRRNISSQASICNQVPDAGKFQTKQDSQAQPSTNTRVEDDFSTSEEEVLEEPRRSSRIRKVLWRKACQNPANSTPDDPINLAD